MSNTPELTAEDAPVDAARVRAFMRGPLGSLGSTAVALAACIFPLLRLFSLEKNAVVLNLGFGLDFLLLVAVPPLLTRYEKRHVGSWSQRMEGSAVHWILAFAMLTFILLLMVTAYTDVPYGWRPAVERALGAALIGMVLVFLARGVRRSRLRGWYVMLGLAYLTGLAIAWTVFPPSNWLDVVTILSFLTLALMPVLGHVELRRLGR